MNTVTARFLIVAAGAMALAAAPAWAERNSSAGEGQKNSSSGGAAPSGTYTPNAPTFYPGGRTSNPMPRNGGALGGANGGLTDAWGGNH